MSRQDQEGGCLCGAVRFKAGGPPSHVNFCHCRMCQKASGAPMMAWATYERSKVAFSGAPKLRPSSATVERGFCESCGSTLIWQRPNATTIDLAVAAFDDPDELAPSEHIWTESRARWLTLTDHLPRYRQRRGSVEDKEAS
ncbi:MAG: GFA family protein [Alphaproteobacteria bacterium]|nr:GFA family protein [Alphaproteobacteria bacterium]